MATATDAIYVKILTDTQQSIKNLGAYIAKMAATYISVKALVGLVKDSVRSYIESENSIARLGVALKITGQYSASTMGQMERLSKAIQDTTVYSDEMARSASGILMQLGNLSTKGVEKILPLIADFASSMGLDLVQAAELVGKSLGGTTNMLGRYGIKLSESKDPQNRFNEMLGEMEKKFGGMAEAMAKTTGGQLQMFINQIDELKEIGGALIAEFLNPTVGWLIEMVKQLQAIHSAGELLTGKTPTDPKGISAAIKQLQDYLAIQRKLYKEETFLTDPFGAHRKEQMDQIVKTQNAIEKLQRTLMLMKPSADAAGQAVGDFVKSAAAETTELVDEMYKYWTMLDEMKRLFEPPTFVEPLVETTKDLVDEAYKYWTMNDELNRLFGEQYVQLSKMEEPLMSLNEITRLMSEKWKPIEDSVKSVGFEIAMIGSTFGEMFASGDIESGIKRIMSQMIDLTTQACIYAAAASVPNWPMVAFFLGLAGITAFGGAALQSFITKSPNIPGMASGGIVTKPTLALVGESGPEAIVPLGKGTGGVTVNVYGSIWQTEDLARAVANKMGRW